MREIITTFVSEKKIIAAVGYGIVPLLKMSEDNQKWCLKDKTLTGVPLIEEGRGTSLKDLPFFCGRKG